MFIVCIEKGQNIISHLCDSEVESVSAEAAWLGASHKIHYELEICVCVTLYLLYHTQLVRYTILFDSVKVPILLNN